MKILLRHKFSTSHAPTRTGGGYPGGFGDYGGGYPGGFGGSFGDPGFGGQGYGGGFG